MWENAFIALIIMGKGMAGIFIATLLIIAVVCLLTGITAKKDGKEQQSGL